jgi:ribonuclease G
LEKLIVNVTGREKRFALMKGNQVEKIVMDRPGNRSLVGNIYYGTITKVLPGMNAAFVDIGEEKNAYLHRDTLASYVLSSNPKSASISSFVHQGEKLLVQVDKDATGTKGPRVTGIIELQGSQLIYMPNGRYAAVSKKIADESQKAELRRIGQQLKKEEEGLIFRTSSVTSSYEELEEELHQLRQQYEEIVRKSATLKKPGTVFQKDTFFALILETVEKMTAAEVIIDDLAFKKKLEQSFRDRQIHISFYSGKENIFVVNRVESEIDKALKRMVWLNNGAYLVFDQTEALTIIDVNTGKFSGKGDYQDTVLKTNQLAAAEIVHQLGLRDIGGMILIDFIDMKRDQDKNSVLEVMETELRKDEKRTKIIGFTPLGVLQLTRKRTKVSLSETLQVKCPVCEGTGRILSAETIAFRLERELLEHRQADIEAVLVETTKDVKESLIGKNGEYTEAIEEAVKMKVFFQLKVSPEHYYIMKQFGNVNELAHKTEEFY